ncbi:hypothetical protein [Gracilibacillus kekensis]|uniref:hypothetical protein n=1 Tax=Gracilibacillus kekensis TaxID=1027249 RepID=UPI00093477FA|nr:hypothetical protein [Gracilibacillus kekensis]
MLIIDLSYLEEQFKNNDIASVNSKELNVFWYYLRRDQRKINQLRTLIDAIDEYLVLMKVEKKLFRSYIYYRIK